MIVESVVGEVYPSLFTRRLPEEGRDGIEQPAYAAATWLHQTNHREFLGGFLNRSPTDEERGIA